MKLNFNVRVWENLVKAPASRDAATLALAHAADYLRRGEPLPMALAEHIAHAFEKAVQVAGYPEPKKLDKKQTRAEMKESDIKLSRAQERALSSALFLRVNRRPDASWLAVAAEYNKELNRLELRGEPLEQAIDSAKNHAMKRFNIKRDTLRRYLSEYKAARAAHDLILEEEDRDC